MENTTASPPTQPQPSSTDTKTCRKCGKALPATTEFFYRNQGGKFGLTPRCKPCVNEDNKSSHADRMLREPDKVRQQATSRSKRSYWKNIEVNRQRHREYARKNANPDKKRRSKLKADYGMTPEQWQIMFESQGCKCAICGSTEPGSKNGWNTDHCHKTKRVRFILCAHCNRGLGAFRDNPELMRKAADMLEEIQNRPVEARHG